MQTNAGKAVSATLPFILLYGLLATNAAAANSRGVLVFGGSEMDKAAESRYGADIAPYLKDLLADFVAEELDRQYPCQGTLTINDLGAMLDLARMRDLLGTDAGAQMDALTSIGGAVGAKYSVDVRVKMIGGQVFVSSTSTDISRGRVIARDTANFAYGDGTNVPDELNRLAKRLVGSLGASLPKCPPKSWKGTVGVTISQNQTSRNSSGNKVDDSGEAQLTCQLTGEGSNARCSYSSKYVMTGPGGSLTINKSANNAATSVSVSLGNGKLTLSIASIKVNVNAQDTNGTPNLGAYEDTLSGDTFELPAGSDPKSQSGSWKNPDLLKERGATLTVNWNLTRD